MGEWPFEEGCAHTPAGRKGNVSTAALQDHLQRNPGDSHAYVELLVRWWKEANPAALELLPSVRTLAPYNSLSLAVQLEAALARGDVESAVRAAVALVERGQHKVRPILVQLMLNPEAQPLLIDAVQPGTHWLGAVLSGLDARTPVGAMQPLIARGLEVGVLKPNAVLAMVDRLKQSGNWLDGYLLWVAWNGKVEEGLYNGGFDRRILRRGFDWEWTEQTGIKQGLRVTQVSAAPQSGWMLELEATGRAALPNPLLSQAVVLLQERYRLRGRWMADRFRTRDGLVWRMRCLSGGEPFSQTSALLDTQRQWYTFEMDIEVPPTCGGALRLTLEPANLAEARMGMAGLVYIDDVRLEPIPERR